MSEENIEQVHCRACSKLIASDAAFCSHCGAKQEKKKGLPSQFKLFWLNLMCPGAGDWCLGEKLRATVFFLVVMGGILGYCLDILPLVQKAVGIAVRTGKTSHLMKLEEEIGNNYWFYIFSIGYILSFIDSFFLLKAQQKKLKEEEENGR